MPIEFYIAALHNWVLSDAFNSADEKVIDRAFEVDLDALDYEYAHGLVAECDVSPDYVAPSKVLTEDELKTRIIEALSSVGVQLWL